MSKIKSHLAVFAIAVVCGLVAGVTGEIITRVYFLKDFSIPYFNDDINVADLNGLRPNLIIRDAKKVVVNQDVKVNETISSIQPSLVKVFREISLDPAKKSVSGTVNQEYYNLAAPLLNGLIITSDGWVASPLAPGSGTSLTDSGYIAISHDRKIYKIDKVLEDPSLPDNIVFFHLADVANLPVKKIASRDEISLGQSVLVINNLDQALLSSLASFSKGNTVLSSDDTNVRLGLADTLGDDFETAFVFNLAGDFLAFINNKEIIPAFAQTFYWQKLLITDYPGQAFLGVNYLDLSSVQPLTISLNKGAWLYSAPNQPAVVKNSPAQKAGLKEGDVILSLDNQEINAANDLADIIAKYQPNDKVTLRYWRDGREQIIELALGARANK